MTGTHAFVPPPAAAVSGPHAADVSASLVEQAAAIRRGELSSHELTRMYLERIDALDAFEVINAFILSRGDDVLAEAARLDELQASGRLAGPLHGIPLGIKDNLFTAGTVTSGGTAVLGTFIPDADATAVRLLKEAGALVLGKTNLHECSFGITSNNPHYGAVRNPYDPLRIPGGSSGGSGAAVAARLCSAAMGSDSGGSVRIPAALCGVVGLKPTLGRVSRGRTFGLSWSYDVVGPIARTAEDAAALLRVIASGSDPLDPFASRDPSGAVLPETVAADATRLRGLRVGIPDGYFAADNTPDVDRVLARTYRLLEDAGAVLVPVSVEGVEQATHTGFLTVIPEAVVLTGQALREAGVPGGIVAALDRFGADVRAALGGQVGPEAQPVPAFAYAEAMARTVPAIRRGFADALAEVDVLLTATTPATAVPIAEDVTMRHNGRTADTFETFIRYTFCVSMAGLPAISVPAGVDQAGLPIGVQFVGQPWSEAKLLEIACAYERLAHS
ncbi:indoleacetamide hydrolase [Nonomuraea monospora]|uniref:Indoleacetamide hydrolase n=1 Tax=Nonomuraea monospora TaxID=568818 RepID=A0ABN3D2I6_9ACTN